MAEESLNIRPYKRGDEYAINDLFNKVFNKSRTIGEWNWKFIENPASEYPAEWITIAQKNGKVIGHYAGLSCEMKFKNKVVIAGHPVDTVLDPSSNEGLKTLHRLSEMNIANNKGIASFGFGFPNEKAYAVGKRFLGYRDLGEILQLFMRLSLRTVFKRRINWLSPRMIKLIHNISKLYYRLSIFILYNDKSIVIRQVDSFDGRIDRLWDRVKDTYEIMLVRKHNYLNWRYKSEKYKILIGEKKDDLTGYAVIKVEDSGIARVGYIMDLFSTDYGITSLLAGVLNFFIDKDVDYVLCGLLKDDPLCAYLKKKGFKEHAEIEHINVVVKQLAKEVDMKHLLNRKNWHLTYGDTDGF